MLISPPSIWIDASAWIPSSPEDISSDPPLITTALLELIESSDESIPIVPPVTVIKTPALRPLALADVEAVVVAPGHWPQVLPEVPILVLLFPLPLPVRSV